MPIDGVFEPSVVGTILQFIIAILLAFIGFVLQNLRRDTENSLKIAQSNQVAIGQLASKLDDLGDRLDRLERVSDLKQEKGSG